MSTWVLSPCHRGRLDELRDMLWSLDHDPARTVVVTTLPDPIEGDDLTGVADHVVVFERPGMLFGEWLNLGFDYIASLDSTEREILCIGSSLRGTASTVQSLASSMRCWNLTMTGPDLFGLQPWPAAPGQDPEEARTLWNRIPGICFMVPGELGLRFDPQFRWWYSDDDFEMQARQRGIVGLIGGMEIILTAPNGHPLSEEQARWATEDRAKFVAKWGREPW